MTSSIDRRGLKSARCKARIASSPPSTPTVPSYMPACGIASVCEPVATAGNTRIASKPAGENIAGGIDAHLQSGCFE